MSLINDEKSVDSVIAEVDEKNSMLAKDDSQKKPTPMGNIYVYSGGAELPPLKSSAEGSHQNIS